MKKALFVLTLLAPFCWSGPAGEPAIVWDGSGADFFSDHDGPFVLGFQFRVESDLAVTALGAYDYQGDGLLTSHRVGIWRADGGELMATATVPAGSVGSLVGQFRYVDVPGISLAANTEYIVGASDFYGVANDIYAGSVPVDAFSVSAAVTFLGFRSAGEGPGLVFPHIHFDALSPTTLGANLRFEPVPEPSTWTLLGSGLVLWAWVLTRSSRRRNLAPG